MSEPDKHVARILDFKFKIGELVYHNGIAWWVTGVRAIPGYGVLNWEYQISKPTSGGPADAARIGWIGGNVDIDNKTVREDQIQRQDEAMEQKRKELETRQEELRVEIERLQAEQDTLKERFAL